ncbi:hypothetical protein AB4Z01_19305 [Inquilinus sp. YAF38]|uniref:hypothetical protein n=1 Tax=Inquilinus sp. YAF38 TaxID=3233084 RepID=UPI003F90F810
MIVYGAFPPRQTDTPRCSSTMPGSTPSSPTLRINSARPDGTAALLEENLRTVLLLLDPATAAAPAPKRCLRHRALLLAGFDLRDRP